MYVEFNQRKKSNSTIIRVRRTIILMCDELCIFYFHRTQVKKKKINKKDKTNLLFIKR